MTYIPEIHWGDGSDGNAVLTTDTDLAGVVKQYKNLTIQSGVKLYDSTGLLRVFVKGKLILDGDIDQTGQGVAGGAGGVSGTAIYLDIGKAGSPGNPGLIKAGNGAGAGMTSSTRGLIANGSGGLASTSLDSTVFQNAAEFFDLYDETVPSNFTIGASGAGGGGGCPAEAIKSWINPIPPGSWATGGAGGAGGGCAIIYAKLITGSGNIKADGGDGGLGLAPRGGSSLIGRALGGSGGGGGGGGGGLVMVYYRASDNAFSVSAVGGAGGLSEDVEPSHTKGGTGADGLDGVAFARRWV